MSEVRKRKRKFEIGFKRQVVQEVESGSISLPAAGRKYEISAARPKNLIARFRSMESFPLDHFVVSQEIDKKNSELSSK